MAIITHHRLRRLKQLVAAPQAASTAVYAPAMALELDQLLVAQRHLQIVEVLVKGLVALRQRRDVQPLRQALHPEGLVEGLLAMPNVGDDADFERLDDLPRELDLR